MSAAAIGIFGGTFNPIHYGHLRSALEVKSALALDKVLMIPAAQPPLRDTPAVDATLRASWVEQAVADEPGLECDLRELRREGPSYTVDTLASLRKELGAQMSISLILGTDTLESLDRWQHWQKLVDYAHIVVLARPGWRTPSSAVVRDWLAAQPSLPIDAVGSQPCGAVVSLELRQLDVSATEIRAMVAAGNSPRYLLPDVVWQDIRARGAYLNNRAAAV